MSAAKRPRAEWQVKLKLVSLSHLAEQQQILHLGQLTYGQKAKREVTAWKFCV
jgi:hypothetical protein